MQEQKVSIPIGKEIKILRSLLEMTQEDFAKLILLNRVTLSKLEKAEKDEDISDEMVFRLYYLTKTIIENPSYAPYVRGRATKIYEIISDILKRRSTEL